MRDQMTSIHPVRAISPVATAADNTPIVSAIIDLLGFNACTFLILLGALPDADATFAVLLEHGDNAALSDAAAVADAELVGTEVLAAFNFGDDNEVRKIGYIGSKRYVRLTITPVNNASATLLAAVAVLGHPSILPTANPPI